MAIVAKRNVPELQTIQRGLAIKLKFFQLFIFFILVSLLPSCTYYFGNSWVRKFPEYEKGSLPVNSQLRPRNFPSNYAEQPIIQEFAGKELKTWDIKGKSGSPRVILAKLALGQDIEKVNEVLLASRPWGVSGATSPYFKKGDYDFTQITLISVLHLFGGDRSKLSQEALDHLLDVLLIEDGGKPKIKAPRTMRIMRDTENHILMTEITRYLKNQWIYSHGNKDARYSNKENGLEDWFIKHLEEMQKTGMYEFNARPYLGYTVSALLTIHAFADSDRIVQLSQEILDQLNYEYAIGSLDLRRSVPFRRRLERANNTDIYNEAHTAVMKAWLRKAEGKIVEQDYIDYGRHHAMIALMLPYELPQEIIDLTLEKPEEEYLAQIGHGYKASPEIHSGGSNYMISAGGVQRKKISQIVARPTVLMLHDGTKDYKDCFHLKGKGEMKKWNNTGVYHRFACSNAPVYIPDKYKAIAEKSGWQIFKPYSDDDLLIAVFNTDDLGLLLLFPDSDGNAQNLANELAKLNPSTENLHHTVATHDGKITISYDLKSPKNKWVITHTNGEPTDRNFDFWPRLKTTKFLQF